MKDDPAMVADAEIVVVGINSEGQGRAGKDIEKCIFEARAPSWTYTAADWKPYQDQLDQFCAEVWKLRRGAPTVLRTFDRYVPNIRDGRTNGVVRQCTHAFETLSAAARKNAQANGAVMAPVYDAFNGPRHLQDPVTKGLIGADLTHTTDKGEIVIADLLAATGFHPTPPPAQ